MAQSKRYLASSIRLDSRLKTGIACVGRRLSNYPNLQCTSQGSRLSYLIRDDEKADRFNVLDLDRSSIGFTTYCESSPTYFMRESISRLLAITMLLSEDYEIEYLGLMPYIVYLLSNGGIQLSDPAPVNFNRDSDIILSKRIFQLKVQCQRLGSDADMYKRAAVSLASSILLARYAHGFYVAEASKELGIDSKVLICAIDLLKASGHRVCVSRSGRIELLSA